MGEDHKKPWTSWKLRDEKKRKPGKGGPGLGGRANESLTNTIMALMDATPILQRVEILKTYCPKCGDKYCKSRKRRKEDVQ